jgi:hypothetical protein
MRPAWTVVLSVAVLAFPCTASAQVRLDPDWVVHIAPITHGSAAAPDAPNVAEAELLRLVAAQQEHYRRTSRFTAYLSELTWDGRTPAVRLSVTAGPDWLLATAVPHEGMPMQAAVWRKGARVESGTTTPPEAVPAEERSQAGPER